MCQDPSSDSKQHGQTPEEKRKPLKTVKSNASWADNFFAEFGRKGPGSDPDWDLRPKSLRKVEEGKGICDSCRGTGAMTCTFCMGVDYYDYDGSLKKCPGCDGKKTVTCSVCFGSKKQVELVSCGILIRIS